MAEFTSSFQSLRPSFPFSDIDTMEITNQFKGMVMPFSSHTFFCSPQLEFPGSLEENFSGCVELDHNAVPISLPISSAESEIHENKKRKTIDDIHKPSSEVSESGSKTKNSSGIGSNSKRVKRNVTEDKKPSEVVHVRARRGQATDSHSLAERVRRRKINEKLKCLQNIVPGCYKSMGMAIMLDEIINYVQSLQHQVEFLSMKLTAASSFYDFNSETDALETMQREKALEAKELAMYVREGFEGVSCFQPSWPCSL